MHKQESFGALSGILRFLSYAAISWIALPLVAICVGISEHSYPASFFMVCIAYCTIAGWLGALIAASFRLGGDRIYPVFRLAGLFLGGCILAVSIVLLDQQFFGIIFSEEPQLTAAVPVSAVCAYILCAKQQEKRFFEIISFNLVRAMVIAIFIAFLILRTNGIVLPYIPEFAVLCIILLLIYWTAQNQRNIDFMMERREHDIRHLPKKIRTFNLCVLAAFFVLALLSLLLSGPILSVLSVFGGFLQKAMINCAGTGGEEMVSTPQETSDPGIGDSMPPADNSFAWIWAVIVIGILLVFYAPLLWRNIRKGVQTLLRALVSFLRRLRAPKQHTSDLNEEYSDTIEILPSGETNGILEQPHASRIRQWKKDVRQFRKMPEGEEKYRRGYALILEGMTLRNLPLLPSDTPREATEKIRSLLITVPQMEAATECYQVIRYALNTQDTDSTQLNSILHVLETMRSLPEEYKPRLS